MVSAGAKTGTTQLGADITNNGCFVCFAPYDEPEIAVALVPHLMVDREGYRLGWGGGYYDRWLTDFDGFTVCVCRPGRLAEHIPREPFDVPVKLVLIEE